MAILCIVKLQHSAVRPAGLVAPARALEPTAAASGVTRAFQWREKCKLSKKAS